MAERSKARVYGRSLAGVAGSNHAGGMYVCESCECCVLSGRSLCDELITRPEESYRLCCVIVCDPETSRMSRPWPALGCSAREKKSLIVTVTLFYYRRAGMSYSYRHVRQVTVNVESNLS